MQVIKRKIKCSHCTKIYDCVAHKLSNGEFDFGKINGNANDSIVKNCIKKMFMLGKFILLHNVQFAEQEQI